MTIGNLRSGSRVKGKRMPYKGREHPRRPCKSCGKWHSSPKNYA